jgi:hypothetical protein
VLPPRARGEKTLTEREKVRRFISASTDMAKT